MPIYKLTNDQRMFVLRLHAEGYNSGDIKRELLEKYNVSILHNAINKTCAALKWQSRIKEFRDVYMAQVRSVPIANKRIRIDDLERERQRINTLIKKNPRKTKSDVTQYLQLVAELRRLAVVAMEEMEKKPHMFQNVVIGMGDMSDEALHRRKEELARRYQASLGGRAPGVDANSGGIESEDTE